MKQRIAGLALLLSMGAAQAELPADIEIDPLRITVSGISSGGAMAHQLHVAYPDIFSGVAIIAGPPYGCAAGDIGTAFARCMAQAPGQLPVSELAESIRMAAAEGKIGDPGKLADDRVWLFHGANDTVIAAEVNEALAALYAEFVAPENLVYIDDFQAAHTFPTVDQGKACGVAESPFIGACGYDAAGELLRHLHPALTAPAGVEVSEPQQVPLPGAEAALLANEAFLYIPDACADAARTCALHLVLHGCSQSARQIGTAFIEQAGYLGWAEANNIVLAFPQVKPSPDNPLACWDWWGYTGPDYAFRDGAQMTVLAAWVRELAGLRNKEQQP